MHRSFFVVVGCLGLAGCEMQTPIEITAEPAKVAYVKSAPMDRIRSEGTSTTIRSYVVKTGEDGKEKSVEVAGAKCKLVSDHLRAEVVTPQSVVLPKYDQDPKIKDRGVPPSIHVTCTGDGKKGTTLITADPGEIISGSGNLIVDLILIAGSAAVANSADWKYRPAAGVILK